MNTFRGIVSLIFCNFLVFSNCLASHELKLNCATELQISMNGKVLKKENVVESVTIIESENLREVLFTNLEKSSVRNFENENTYPISDSSNQDELVLKNGLKNHLGRVEDTEISLTFDRKSGFIDYEMYFYNIRKVKVLIKLTGKCLKI